MALVLPLMVGAMVGDIAYGALLLAASLFVRRRFGPRSAAVRDLAGVFVAGAVWAIIFGFLFGEALGDLGHRLGLPALWFYRGGADAVEPLLLFRWRSEPLMSCSGSCLGSGSRRACGDGRSCSDVAAHCSRCAVSLRSLGSSPTGFLAGRCRSRRSPSFRASCSSWPRAEHLACSWARST